MPMGSDTVQHLKSAYPLPVFAVHMFLGGWNIAIRIEINSCIISLSLFIIGSDLSSTARSVSGQKWSSCMHAQWIQLVKYH